MPPVTSKLTSKYQATIPAAVRDALAIGKGDEIIFDWDDDGKVTLRKKQTACVDQAYLQGVDAALTEWSSGEDDALFAAL